MTEAAFFRRKLTTLDKLKVLVRYSRCPKCGEKFSALDEIEFDHIGQLALTGDNSLENFRPLHQDCHKAKTASDATARARTRKAASAEEEFRRRMLAKEPGQERPKSRRWPSRPFPKRSRKADQTNQGHSDSDG